MKISPVKITCWVVFVFLLMSSPPAKSQVQAAKTDSARLKLDQLVEKKLLSAVRDIHNKLDLNAFSRAYSTETYLYDVYTAPDKKQPYYSCAMKVVRGAFIIERYEFRANIAKASIEMLNDKTGRYTTVEKWLVFYNNKVTEDEKNKK